MKKRVQVALVSTAQVAVSAAILCVLFRSSSWERFAAVLARVDIGWVTVAVATLAVQQTIAAARWRRIAVALGAPRTGLFFYVLWQGLAVLLLQVMPSTIGGDVLRAASGARRGGLKQATGIVIADRVIGMGVLCVLLLVAAIPFAPPLAVNAPVWAPIAMAITGLGGCAGAMALTSTLQARKLTAPLGRLGAALTSSLRGENLLRVGGSTLLIHLLSVLAVAFLLHAAGTRPDFAVLFVVPAVLLVSAVPISLGGWGIREGAFVFGLGLLGVGRETGLGVSVLFGVTLTLAGLVLTMAGTGAHWVLYARGERNVESEEGHDRTSLQG